MSRLVKARMRVRTPRLVVKVVSGGKRNYEQRSSGGDGEGIIRGRKSIMDGFCMCINTTFCSSSKKAAAAEEEEEEEEEEVGCSSSSARKINMLKEVVAHRLMRTINVPNGKSQLGIKGETTAKTQKLGRSSFNCLVSRFSGMLIRLKKKKKKKKKSGFRMMRKWKKKKKITMRRSSSVGAVKKSFARIRSCRLMRMGRKMMRKEEEIELCKKRILMGEKCKPLNVSGSLHYDKNGVLLPELLLPCE